jgi:hypothetical protein
MQLLVHLLSFVLRYAAYDRVTINELALISTSYTVHSGTIKSQT